MRTLGLAVVVGAGTMGGGIAADLANAGWRVRLLDQTREFAEVGKARVMASSPPLLYLPEYAERIVPGTSEELGICADADWVIEAIAEKLMLKQALLSRLESAVGPETLITSNTSGLSLTEMSKHCGMEFRRRFFGTHFFNPPRYLKLVEVVPTPATSSDMLHEFIAGLEAQTNHRVVVAKDTPGFISTRLWITHLLDTIHTAIEQDIPVEVVDALTGPALGRPRSATFRMADLVGLDIIASIAKNQYESLPDDPLRERLRLPEPLERLIADGRTGQKAGAGFYKRVGREIRALDWQTLTYRSRQEENTALGKELVGTILPRFFGYVEAIAGEISDSEEAIDNAMCWGFGWQKGPFAMARRAPDPPVTPALREYEGALVFELHGKLNVFDPALCIAVEDAVSQAEARGCPLIFTGQGSCFSAGYNLARLVAAMERGDLEAIEADMKQCQEIFLRVKHATIPTVAAIHGYTLGAGCELALHCGRIVASPETVLGLPECAVGVIPCGGGVKEALFRFGSAQAAFEAIAFNQNSTSAHEARKRGWLRASDRIVANADHLLVEARVAAGLPAPVLTQPLAHGGLLTLPTSLTGQDRVIAQQLAWVLTSGPTDEAALLERERAAFRVLALEPLSIARMRHLLDTGKPLKN